MSTGETLIKVEGVSKKFCRKLSRSMYYGMVDSGRNMLGIPYQTDKLRKDEFWALKDINFELKRGETLGIIGANGSGKSTLLRLLTGIYPPDEGQISIKGRVGALIAVGAGFHPHMTGRENIYLNGTVLGMNKQEIDAQFDDIVEFSELKEFLDAPVATYSSGMKVKLGFSIAISCKPDILLVDEVLSVGDLAFRNKSMRKMAEYREKANGLIYISHNLEQTRVLCDKIAIINYGNFIYYGETHQGIVKYQEMSRNIRMNNLKKSKLTSGIKLKGLLSSDKSILEIANIGICDNKSNRLDSVELNSPLFLFCEFSITSFVEQLYFSVGIFNEEYKPCIWLMSNDNKKSTFENLNHGTYKLLLKIENHHLMPGVYIPNIAIRNGKTNEIYERILPDISFKVKSDNIELERGFIKVEENWELHKC